MAVLPGERLSVCSGVDVLLQRNCPCAKLSVGRVKLQCMLMTTRENVKASKQCISASGKGTTGHRSLYLVARCRTGRRAV